MEKTVNGEPMEVVIHKDLKVELLVGEGTFTEPEFLHSKPILGWEQDIFIFRVGLVFNKVASKYYKTTGKYISFIYDNNQECVDRQKEILADIKTIIRPKTKHK